jgi:hypothetical protein
MFIALASYSAIGASTAAGLLLVLGVPAIAAFLVSGGIACQYVSRPRQLGLLVEVAHVARWLPQETRVQLALLSVSCLVAHWLIALLCLQTWLRVALGYHTVPQVLAGWLVGGCSAAAWHSLGRYQVLPGLQRRTYLQVS